MMSQASSRLSGGGGLSVPSVGKVITLLRESLLLSMAAFGFLMFLFSAAVLTPMGEDVVGALLGVAGLNVAFIGLFGYAVYKSLDRIF